jgi:hypothetical protein
MVIHVYHPYRQPDGENYCQAVNGHCSHLCLPAPQINSRSPKISCACPDGLRLLADGLMCGDEGNWVMFLLPLRLEGRQCLVFETFK